MTLNKIHIYLLHRRFLFSFFFKFYLRFLVFSDERFFVSCICKQKSVDDVRKTEQYSMQNDDGKIWYCCICFIFLLFAWNVYDALVCLNMKIRRRRDKHTARTQLNVARAFTISGGSLKRRIHMKYKFKKRNKLFNNIHRKTKRTYKRRPYFIVE